MSAAPTIMIMAGGTGGHVLPGLAVAAEMRKRAWNVVWLGHPEGIEARLTAQHQIPLFPVIFSGFRGKGLLQQAFMPLNILRAFVQSVRALRSAKPQVVLGMGGYIALPGGMMASLLGKPLVVHEQNSIAGLTNKILARLADRCLNAFPNALPQAQWVGNPVREDLMTIDPPEERYNQREGALRIAVVGGSLGASALNEIVPKALALLPKETRPIVTHQSGRGHLDKLNQHYRDAGVQASTSEFIDDMRQIYADTDLLICRSGAMTVSEITAVGIASLLVPFPAAVDDHQTTNGKFLVDVNGAQLLQQKDLTPDKLAVAISQLNRSTLKRMAIAAHALAKPSATREVADVCEALAKKQ